MDIIGYGLSMIGIFLSLYLGARNKRLLKS